jgi:PIN domain nuclease of toxin-antitoxin system
VSLLLDTHVALWALAEPTRLCADLLDRLRHDPEIYLSPVTLWEITLKQAVGKLAGPANLAELVRDLGFLELPITHAHALLAGRLPLHHPDPFDRMLVAQAKAEGFVLATRNEHIPKYDVQVLAV